MLFVGASAAAGNAKVASNVLVAAVGDVFARTFRNIAT